MWVALLAGTAHPAAAAECPNAAARIENNSTGLPDCRAYEMVTNPFKEAFAPGPPTYTNDGDAFTYRSSGNFAGNSGGGIDNRYVATRSATGWTTVAPGPPGSTYANLGRGSDVGLSSDLRSSLWQAALAGASNEMLDFYLRSADGTFTRIGPALNPATRPPGAPGAATGGIPADVGGSADLSHLMFLLDSTQIFPGTAPGANATLYEYVGTGNNRPELVGVDNDGNQIAPGCNTYAGSSVTHYRAMSTDGRVIFWSACNEGGGLWARVNRTTTFRVSESLCTRAPADPGGPCNAPAVAVFQGANAEGTRVYFTTTQQLVNGDTDESNDLYACDIPAGAPAPVGTANSCSALNQVSAAASDASVEGVLRVSDDGSRVYFAARGVLANLGANNAAAVAGDDNLYVWRKDAAYPAGHTTFVGKLDPGDGGLWAPEAGLAGRSVQTTKDGRYLVLATLRPLVSDGPNADTDSALDIYRYDADTEGLVRLSATTAGDGGNAAGLDATITPIGDPSQQVITADGRTVVFRTSEALVADDINGSVDVYAWHDGRVSLISSGRPTVDDTLLPSTMAFITASGLDIYFSTTRRLTAVDSDTQVDFYDARVDGGFHFPRPASCSGDGCRDARSPVSSAPAPASDTVAGQAGPSDAAPTFALRGLSAAQRKRFAATGKVTLTLTSGTAATLTAKATATIARKSVSVASARRTVVKAGTTSLALTLSKQARKQLSADGRLTVKIVVGSSVVAVDRSVTLKLTHAKSKKMKAKKSAERATAGVKGGRS